MNRTARGKRALEINGQLEEQSEPAEHRADWLNGPLVGRGSSQENLPGRGDRSFSKASIRAMGPHGAVQGTGLFGSEAFSFVSTSCICWNDGPGLHPLLPPTRCPEPPPMCPPACPTSFPNVPVLSLSVTKPHSVRNLLFFPHFKYRIKEQKIWSWFLPARREKNETEAQDSNVPKDWEHSNFPFSIPFSPTSAPTLPEGSTLHPSTYHGKLGMRSPHRLSWQCLWHILGRQTHLQAPEKEGGSYWGKLFLGGNTDIWHTFSMLSFLMCLLMPSIPPLLPYSKYTRPCHPNNNRVRVAWGP